MRRALFPLLVVAAAACAATTSPADKSFGMRKQVLGELINQADWPAAFDAARQLHLERPDDAQVLAARGIIYREQRLYREAGEDFAAALALDPELAAAHAGFGVLLDLQGRPEEALARHRRAVELVPDSPEFLNNLGFSLFAHGKTDEALGVLQRAVSLDPMNTRARNNLGFAHAKRGDFREAAHHFNLGGSPAQAKNNLGFAYEQDGNLAQAFELYAEATRLDPTLERARTNLTHVAQRLGRPLPTPASPPANEGEQR